MKISYLIFTALCTIVALLPACSSNEPCTESIWYQDADGDGLGNPDMSLQACEQPDNYVSNSTDADDSNAGAGSVYTGTASVTQGLATTTTENVFINGGRVAGLGTIDDLDGTTWTVPAEVHFTNSTFPFSSDLYNDYGNKYNSAAEAIGALDGSDIIEVDAGGEIITAYIFADNYFEMYVNGAAVGKDAVPFTQFNSSIVRFRVSKPYTIVMKLVDWEENLGLGSEANQGSAYHAGDGGMVAIFNNESNEVVAMTGSDWKAQTFYSAPIKDLSCPTENGSTRSTASCNTDASDDGSSYYGLHWAVEDGWETEGFDDSDWPNATTFPNDVIGVNNKPSYTNFTDIFDDPSHDAQFIWSTNVILDNEVIVRYTVE